MIVKIIAIQVDHAIEGWIEIRPLEELVFPVGLPPPPPDFSD